MKAQLQQMTNVTKFIKKEWMEYYMEYYHKPFDTYVLDNSNDKMNNFCHVTGTLHKQKQWSLGRCNGLNTWRGELTLSAITKRWYLL